MPTDWRTASTDSPRGDAGPLAPPETGMPAGEAILVACGDRTCLVPLAGISEVIAPPREITPVPFAASWLLGITHYRGNLLPVFDLAGFFTSLGTELVPQRGEEPKVLVVQHLALPFGCLVTRIIGKRRPARRSEPIEGETTLPGALVSGVDVQDGRHHPILDLEALADGLQNELSATEAGLAAR